MAGAYAQIREEDGKVIGTGQGCGCCGYDNELTQKDLEDEMLALENEIELIRELLAKHFDG
jgi:hypothetical protein